MNKLIIDVTCEKIFLMIITSNDVYNITKENTKINYEKLTLIINDFLNSKKLDLKEIKRIYLNRGPGSFAGIRNLISIVKAFNLTNNIFKTITKGVNKIKNKNNSFLIITHYEKLLENIIPNFIHIMKGGKIIKTGDRSLAKQIEKEGFQRF